MTEPWASSARSAARICAAGRSSTTASVVSVTGPTSSRRLRRISASASSVAVLRALELRGALDGDPEPVVEHHPPLVAQPRELRLPRLDLGRGQEAVHDQRIVQLVVVADLRPGLGLHALDRVRIEAAEVGGVLRLEQALASRWSACGGPSASPSSRKA